MQPKTSTPHERGGRIAVDARLERALRGHIGSPDFENWFEGRTSLRLEGEEFVLGVGSPFLVNWMQTSFREKANAAAREAVGPAGRTRFEVDPALAVAAQVSEESPADVPPKSRPRPVSDKKPPAGKTGRTRRFLDLAEFVEGECNRLAVVASRRVCEQPGEGCNPLLLVGSVGTGKTHLLEGMHRRLCRERRDLEVAYLNAEAFGNYFVEALKERTLPAFRQRFRNVDVLLVDDVEFFDGKRVMQEEFLNTVKQLERGGRQLVVAAGRHPRLMKRLGEELSTRLTGGIVCRLEPPDDATRREIVGRRAKRANLDVEPEALDHVARRFRNSVRELDGAVGCLETWAAMTRQRVTLRDARRVLAELERDCARVVRMSDVERVVCEFFGVEPEDLRSTRRHRAVSRPRMLVMFLARKLIGSSYSEIGRHFDRNHTTVLAAEKKVHGWIAGHETVRVSAQAWTMDDVVVALERELAG
jgi:chromosomal replication initiator protein